MQSHFIQNSSYKNPLFINYWKGKAKNINFIRKKILHSSFKRQSLSKCLLIATLCHGLYNFCIKNYEGKFKIRQQDQSKVLREIT